ncbi:MAG: hypothetical protein GXZ11_06385 [Tissierellia bacterium]|nr:hypothetical protein [Tissierellia bacterium]
MKKLIIAMVTILFVVSFATPSIGVSTSLKMETSVVVTVDKPINTDNIEPEIATDKGIKVPVITKKLSDKKILVTPLFNMKDISVNWKGPGKLVSWEPYKGEVFIDSEANFKKITTLSNKFFVDSGPPVYYALESTREEPLDSQPQKETDYTDTNTQVLGVDEGDIVKTDGKTIFYATEHAVYLVNANPTNPKVLSKISWAEHMDEIRDIYIDGNKLIFLGIEFANNNTVIKVFNVADRFSPKDERTILQSGFYSSSRKIGDNLYIISNKSLYEDFELYYKDTVKDSKIHELDYGAIRILPGGLSNDISVIGSFNVNDKSAMNASAILGSSNEIYMSESNIYLSYTPIHFYYTFPNDLGTAKEDELIRDVSGILPNVEQLPEDEFGFYTPQTTYIRKFSADKGNIAFLSEAEISGTLINQFSMDEYNGNFRVAYETFDVGKGVKSSAISIFDKDMKNIGNLKNIAPSENMHSIRFIGDRAYMVTFKNVDPFFVLDLKNPKEPKMLGYLKIPGFSDYLHPLDDNHIIGFGYDTKEYYGNTFATGIKIAVFDVNDVSNPKVKNQIILGDKGSYASILEDHKALMYDKEKNIFAFPAILTKVKEGGKPNEYGDISFQGALVFSVNNKEGVKELGRISHVEKGTESAPDEAYFIDRIIRIVNTYYTLSEKQVRANSTSDFSLQGKYQLQQ